MARLITQSPDTQPRLTITTIAEMNVPPDEALRVSRIRSGDIHRGHVYPFGNRDVDSLRIFLKDAPRSTLVTPGGATSLPPARAFQAMLCDLRAPQAWWSDYDLDLLTFDLPAAAIERRARVLGVRLPAGLSYDSGVVGHDETLEGFAQAVLPYMHDPATAPRLFIDHILHSVCAYVIRRHGTDQDARGFVGGLAPWQERRAKAVIQANLDGPVSLKALADACRLSPSHFARAFRQSTGQTPHQWLIGQRIERAMAALMAGETTLAAVASDCGFSDQSHFTNVFTRRVGASPGAWRRQRLELAGAL